MSRVEGVKVIDEKSILFGPGVFGKHAGQASLIFLVKRRTKPARQFEPSVQVQFIGLRRMGVFELGAKPMPEYLEHELQSGDEIHGRSPIVCAARRTSS